MAFSVSAVAPGTRCRIGGADRSVLAVRVNADGFTELLVGRRETPLEWVVMSDIDGAWTPDGDAHEPGQPEALRAVST